MANTPRAGVNANGSVPLADTGSGAAGTLLGTERSKLQGILSTYGNNVQPTQQSLAVAGTWYEVAVTPLLPAGIYLLWGTVVAYPNTSNSLLYARLNFALSTPFGEVSVNATPPSSVQLVIPPQVFSISNPNYVYLQAKSGSGAGTGIANQMLIGYCRIS